MWSDFQREAMSKAIAEANRGRPSPNPRVGAALAKGSDLIALGYHANAGEAHAEVDAIRNAGAEAAQGATLFVTLEPCNHHGRTGPCTEAIIGAGIDQVVIGSRDPAPHEPGAIERLKDAGIQVQTGLLQDETDALVADFAKHIRTGLPFVTLKAAITLDGKIATRTGDSKWITGEEARAHGHRMRDDHDAILVGVGTVLADNPALTVRHVQGRDPIRVVLDASLRTPPDAQLLTQTSDAPTWIIHATDAELERVEALQAAGATLMRVDRHERGIHLAEALRALAQRDVVRLLVEGGARVHGSFLDLGLADRAALFVAPRLVGDAGAISLADGTGSTSIAGGWHLERSRVTPVGQDWLVTGDLRREA